MYQTTATNNTPSRRGHLTCWPMCPSPCSLLTMPVSSHLSMISSLFVLLLLLCCAIVRGDDYESSDSAQIVDDYNDPIPQVAKHDNVNDDDDDLDHDPDQKLIDKMESDYGKPDSDEIEDVDGEPDDDDDDQNTSRRTKARHQLAVHDEEEPTSEPPLPLTSSTLPPSDTEKPPRPEPKLGPDFRSMLVKVYRGPTKQINEKPFASWGYFVKYPSENSKSPTTVAPVAVASK